MRKKSHIALAGFLVREVDDANMQKHWKAFYFGSILPDLTPKMITDPHEFDSSYLELKRRIAKLLSEAREHACKEGTLFCRLGVVMHYLADYFTYPHNTIFEGTIPEHYTKEKKMTRWMREGALEQMSLPMCKKLDSAAEVEERLQELHDRYLSQKMCYENDMAYMRQMVSEILNCYAEIFVRKSEFARFMEWVRKKVGIMTGFVS